MSDIPLHAMFVGGQPTSTFSGKTFEVENPATGEIIARVPRRGRGGHRSCHRHRNGGI
jgi:acyl-CoA reductase-like NAD-dependent aldehyde dehydrogenase